MNEQDQEESVLCFERSFLDGLGAFHGIYYHIRYATLIFRPVFVPRSKAEKDPRYKQVIPYIVIKCGNNILRYRRGVRGGEYRLHEKLSIGIGGHINSKDKSYEVGVRRELQEEIDLRLEEMPPIIGVVNNDDTEVGRVHFGVVHLLTVESESVAAKCASVVDPEFFDPMKERKLESYEDWSQLILRNFGVLWHGNYQ